ncbi:CoaE-domain-containing protein [Cyathus striatus]|nr:CoaE-domain-containing protein [Cyathus striatus]
MLVIGLTGGIATGKSTVSSLWSHQIPIVNADIIAREVVQPGTSALADIVKVFGPEALLPNGSLDRKKLGSLIFNDGEERKKLNGIVHPAVWREMVWQVVWHWIRGEQICVFNVPLLIEGGLWKWVGKVVVVYCNSGSKQELEEQEEASVKRWMKEAAWAWRLSWLLPPYGLAAAAWSLFLRRMKKSNEKLC